MEARQGGNAFRVRLRRVAETRDAAYQIVEIESNLFFIPDMLFGLTHSSQTEVVALVESDIKAFHASLAIAGQDEGYRVSDCGEDGGVRTGYMKGRGGGGGGG
ncbi:hypothetical protein M422DRAFT_39370 [Sphaerobolus stellatus SS14]|uniref:Uncharacterized protein n=1 Tax=Sphaerobolus stellatus (strain SS14) TaxID=990650 RepID=A0A0C9T514_SPHS4|nr:hypothetical protein M422DRAFT_39370 [Sphaerobolus stellatus SS14]